MAFEAYRLAPLYQQAGQSIGGAYERGMGGFGRGVGAGILGAGQSIRDAMDLRGGRQFKAEQSEEERKLRKKISDNTLWTQREIAKMSREELRGIYDLMKAQEKDPGDILPPETLATQQTLMDPETVQQYGGQPGMSTIQPAAPVTDVSPVNFAGARDTLGSPIKSAMKGIFGATEAAADEVDLMSLQQSAEFDPNVPTYGEFVQMIQDSEGMSREVPRQEYIDFLRTQYADYKPMGISY